MTGRISVIVANDCSHPQQVAATVESLNQELISGVDEVIWVDRARMGPQISWARYLAAPRGAGRGDMYATGFATATGGIAAFTDSTTILLPGWRGAVVEAFAAGAEVAGGPVLPTAPRGIRYLAGFLSEYGFHSVPPYTSTSGDVAGNNVAYSRRILAGLEGPLWKSEVDRALMSRGIHPVVAPGMRVIAAKTYRWRWFVDERLRQGCLFSASRTGRWSVSRRLGYALAAMVLPLLLLARLVRRLAVDPALRRAFLVSAPLIVVAMVSWSLGESLGALGWGGGDVGPF